MVFICRRIGVIGIDLALSEIEDLLRSSFSGDGEVFMVDLADGTAIVHPLAKHSYEVSRKLQVYWLLTGNTIHTEYRYIDTVQILTRDLLYHASSYLCLVAYVISFSI